MGPPQAANSDPVCDRYPEARRGPHGSLDSDRAERTDIDHALVLAGHELLMIYHPRLVVPHHEEHWIKFGTGSASGAFAVINIGYQGT